MNNVIPFKEKLKFSDLFCNNKVKQIAWDERFDAWPIDRQLEYAKNLASAMNEAADEMQQDRDKCFSAMQLAQHQRDEAQQAAAIAKQTMTNVVLDSNEKNQRLEAQIMDLNQRLKAYE